ncbi:hypothetical protein [Clostridium felsineum]|uniref:hypothetical protein n=1 Tax=Clostridium felsineum TaxID=36839 RepID=UPI00098C251F|nr:hypothetical protein [Clostridium felsineum]URZ18531.1 hypothetical protein CLFE_046190 [Clostridium felsineum DSM 794]
MINLNDVKLQNSASQNITITGGDALNTSSTSSSNEEYEVLEMFPAPNSSMIDTKLKIIYLKVNGLINADDIDLDKFSVEGMLSDKSETNNVPEVKPHGELKGEWKLITDSTQNVSYIVFVPVDLGG